MNRDKKKKANKKRQKEMEAEQKLARKVAKKQETAAKRTAKKGAKKAEGSQPPEALVEDAGSEDDSKGDIPDGVVLHEI